MKKPIIFVLVVLALSFPHTTRPQDWATAMDKVYADESHCLTLPEIRSDKDNPITCYCRDAVEGARYVWFTYVLSGKDQNLNGPFLTLEIRAKELCGESFDVHKATVTKTWKWSGPEVVRNYPSDSEIKRISPDSNGFRLVKLNVRLTYRDAQGRVTKIENYTALEKFPPNWDSLPSTKNPR